LPLGRGIDVELWHLESRQDHGGPLGEFVRAPIFGYAVGVSRRSPLETLKDVRARSKDGEKVRFAAVTQRELAARVDVERSLASLRAAREEAARARAAETGRSKQGAVTAAEGERRALWERAQRRQEAELSKQLERAVESHRGALLEQERAARDLESANVALEQVQGRLDRAESARQRARDAVQQELTDEASLRRFVEQRRS